MCLEEDYNKRILFQVFINPNGTDEVALPPVVSNEIVDKKAHCDLEIVKLSVLTSPVAGKIKMQKVAFVAQHSPYNTVVVGTIPMGAGLFSFFLSFLTFCS